MPILTNSRGLLLTVLFVTSFTVLAQTTLVKGTVKDETGMPLPTANIVLENLSDNSVENFGITDDQGQFELMASSGRDYRLSISYLGYDKVQITMVTKPGVNRVEIIMRPRTENLDEVELIYEMPVRIKGDTIVYKADLFSTGTERKLADVLKNMPGIEIADDGAVEVEGKRVSKVMVEGKDFFEGDSKLASDNIPADAIDKVEVLRNFNEVAQLKMVADNEDNIALNIKLKEGRKKFWFGDIEVGSGPSDRYAAKPKLFYYSPKYSLNFLADLNNIGKLPLTIKDFYNLTGGIKDLTKKIGTTFDPTDNEYGINLVPNDRAKQITGTFGALNFDTSPTKNWNLSGFAIYSDTKTDLELEEQRGFIGSNQIEFSQNKTHQANGVGIIKVGSTYKPHINLQFDMDVMAKITKQNENRNISSVSAISQEIQDERLQDLFSLISTANLYYTLNEKNIFSFETQISTAIDRPTYQAINNRFSFAGIIPADTTQTHFNLQQEKRVITDKFDFKINHYVLVGKKSNFNFSFGGTLNRQELESGLTQVLDSGNELNFDSNALLNDVAFSFTDIYFGIHYRAKWGKLTLTPGALLHNYRLTNRQSGLSRGEDLFFATPDLFLQYEFKQSKNLRFRYALSREFSDIDNFGKGFVLQDYNLLFQGNPDLQSALHHNFSMSYLNFDLFNLQNIFANLTYSIRSDYFKTENSVIGINVVNGTINSPETDRVVSALLNYQRTFGKIRIKGKARYSRSLLFNAVNGDFLRSRSITHNYSLSGATLFKKAPNVELGYAYSLNDYQNGELDTKFINGRPFLELNTKLPGNFFLTSRFENTLYRDGGNTIRNNFSVWTAKLTYGKKESKWEFGLEGLNILDNQNINSDNFNELFSLTTSYKVQPRFFLLSITHSI